MTIKEEFLSIAKQNIKRAGIGSLLDYLEKDTDFFTSPASTKFHLNRLEGLAEHSVNVFKCLHKSNYLDLYTEETISVVSLFHDICKANTYKVSSRQVKNETNGKWETQPFYLTDDKYPFGHGEKSVYLLNKFIQLTDEEALAINWHMGGFDDRVKGGSYSLNTAFNMSVLTLEFNVADMRATYILEK